MVIKKKHAEALERLLKDEEQALPFTPLEEVDEPTARELELMGLLRFASPVRLVPTYWGRELAYLLRELYAMGPRPYAEEEGAGTWVVREAWGLRPPEAWAEEFRFLGSEIVAMLEAADRAGQVGPEGVEPLMARGLAARVWDRERKKEYVALTEQGRRALGIYRALEPGLEVDAALAELIRKLPLGPAEAARLSAKEHEKNLLEAMRLIAYSVPQTEVFTFTALGQAVKRALALEGSGKGMCSRQTFFWPWPSMWTAAGPPRPPSLLSRLWGIWARRESSFRPGSGLWKRSGSSGTARRDRSWP